jgi:membrane associated rhomboid family serine protease
LIPIKDLHASRRTPWVVYSVLVLCVLVYLWQIGLGREGMQRAILGLGLIPGVVTGSAELAPQLYRVPAWMTFVTSMFLHGSLLHLASNLLYLWIFGNNIEDRLGHLGFIVFYVASGVAAAAAQIAPEPGSTIPMIGASGAISGVLGAYLVLYPRSRVVVFIPISFMLLHEIRAFWLLIIWFAVQLISAVGAPDGAGIAWWAHIGGFVAGAVVALPLVKRRRSGPWG